MTVGFDGPGFTLPAYGDRSLADVVPAVARALGTPLEGHDGGFELPTAPSYVVFLVDGMGAELLALHAHAAPYLSSLLDGAATGTAGVPSTTATSLTSLGTGLVPGAHGLVGFTARIPGTDRLLNHLWWDKTVDPVEWQPHPTAFGRLAHAGVHVTTVNKRDFDGSGLTLASQRGATYVGADRVGELIAATVSASAARPSLTYVYDSDLDWTGHKFGVASTQWLQQLAMVDAEAEQLREALAPYAPAAPVVWVQEEPANMGAWRYLLARFGDRLLGARPFSGVCRPASASRRNRSRSSAGNAPDR